MAEQPPSTATASGSRERQLPKALFIVGVSGTGKSTLGNAISKAFGLPYVEGDELHPPSNVAKMSAGHPLNDSDREPWLKLIRDTALKMMSQEFEPDSELNEKEDIKLHEEWQKKDLADEGKRDHGSKKKSLVGVVIGCSALKKYYRDILRGVYKLPSLEGKDLTVETGVGRESGSGHMEDQADSSAPYFVFLKGSREVLLDRMTKRQGHYMKASMLDSQLATMEDPTGESGVVPVSVLDSTEEQLKIVVEELDRLTGLDLA